MIRQLDSEATKNFAQFFVFYILIYLFIYIFNHLTSIIYVIIYTESRSIVDAFYFYYQYLLCAPFFKLQNLYFVLFLFRFFSFLDTYYFSNTLVGYDSAWYMYARERGLLIKIKNKNNIDFSVRLDGRERMTTRHSRWSDADWNGSRDGVERL